MSCPLSALAELAALELRSGEDFLKHLPNDTSCASSSKQVGPVLPIKKRPRTSGGSSASSSTSSKASRSSSNVSETESKIVDYKTFFSPSFKPFKMKTKKPPFPVILMAIMTAPQNEKFISFLSDNQSFIVINPEASMHVLPVHFEDNVPSFEQFVDILATWGFCVGNNDPQFPNVPVYRHGLFRRGDWESCLKMEMPSVNEISANRLHYRNAFQALGENVNVGACTEDKKETDWPSLNNNDKETRVTHTEHEGGKAKKLHQQELFTRKGDSFVFTNPASSLTQMSRRPSLPFATTGVGYMGMGRSGMKEAEINSATDEVVSAAMAALHRHGHGGDAKEAHFFRRHTIDYARNAPSDPKRYISRLSQLDVITEVFLERSMARKLQSRRDSGLLGSNLGMTSFLARTSICDSQAAMAAMGVNVDAKVEVLLTEEQERRASIQSGQ